MGPAQWGSKITAEFDGMVRVDFSVAVPATSANGIEELDLEIPIAASVAKLLQAPDNSWEAKVSQPLPSVPTTGIIWRSTIFQPAFWIGNADHGLQWFAESEDGWLMSDDLYETMSEIERKSDGSAILRLKLFTRELEPGEERHITFGLQATPIRPMPDNYQAKRLAFSMNSDAFFYNDPDRAELGKVDSAVIWWQPGMQYFGQLDPIDPVDYENRVNQILVDNVKPLTYLCLACIQEQSPTFYQHIGSWMKSPEWKIDNCEGSYTCRGVTTASNFLDFQAYAVYKHLLDYDVDGIYIDVVNPHLDNAITPSGLSGYSIFNNRELLKRLYMIIDSMREDGEIVLHNSAAMFTPMLSFGTQYLTGEQYIYMSERDNLTPEVFQTEFMGTNYGVQAQFLPEILMPWKVHTDINERNLLATTLIHGVVPVPIWMDVSYLKELWDRYDWFPIWGEGVSWKPYWDAATPFITSNPLFKVSAYTKSADESLLVVANNDRTVNGAASGSMVRVTDNPALAGAITVKQYMAPDGVEGRILPVDAGGYVWVQLPPWEFAILEVAPAVKHSFYSHDFDDYAAPGWSTVSGTWTAADQKLYGYNLPGESLAVYSGGSYTNFTYSITSSITGGTGDGMALIFGYQDANNYYKAEISKTTGKQFMRLYKMEAGVLTQISSELPYNPPASTPIRLAVKVNGPTMTFNANDGTFNGSIYASSDVFPRGKVGLRLSDAIGMFDDVEVSAARTFAESFATDDARGWEVITGSWNWSSGTYSNTNPSGDAVTAYRRQAFDNFNLQATGRFTSSSASDMDIIFHYQDENHYYQAHISRGAGANYLRLYKKVGGIYTQIGTEAAYLPPLYTDITFTIAVVGSHIYVTIDDGSTTASIVAVDSTYASGKIGFKAFDANVTYDNLNIYQ